MIDPEGIKTYFLLFKLPDMQNIFIFPKLLSPGILREFDVMVILIMLPMEILGETI